MPDSGPPILRQIRAALAPRHRIAAAATVAAAAGIGMFVLLLAIGDAGDGIGGRAAVLVYSAAVTAIAAAIGLLWLVVDLRLLRAAAALAAETRFVAETRSDGVVARPSYPALAPLPEAIAELAEKLIAAHRETDRAVSAATARLEEQKSRLETILRDLSEGVMVCNLDHQVLLYNHVALALLHVTGDLGLGRSLFNLVTREPVLHALERLTRGAAPMAEAAASESAVPLVCATVDARTLLSGRMSLVRDADRRPGGYVLTFADVTRELAELGRRDALLRDATEGLRQPLANLRAAAETAAAYPDLDPARRRAFDEVVLRESSVLSERLETLDRDYRSMGGSHWPMAEVHSVDLFGCIVRRLAETGGPTTTMVGIPLWLHGDSHALALALERILRNLAKATGAPGLDIEALLGDRRVYVQISWSGEPLAAGAIEAWLDEPLPGAPGAIVLRDVFAHHGSELWSRSGSAPGRAILRIPLPAPARVQFAPGPDADLPSRPEFYDFDLLHLTARPEPQGKLALRALTYVVFDTETTGLRPSDGDEIIAIGAVRIVNGRILTGETFSRLVNPGRPIPSQSIRFHGITDAMVADAPPLSVVLPQFKAFVADAVLVAHNAAFDLKFLKLKEAESGVVFDNVPLDTLLISAFLFGEFADHSLDAVARRLGIEISGRHSAAGDAMGTAAIFLRLLDLFEQRGLRTLDDLLGASRMTLEIRTRQMQF
ncbi:MAG: PAS domain-containing protein [Rhodospirillales bacterium]|nr:PAS domain-containing protein [Rhodospirillales bacterium]